MATTAVIATTHKLANGHQFSRADLEGIAAAYRVRLLTDPYLNFNHRHDRPPVAKVKGVWVDQFPTNPTEAALFVEFETLQDADPQEVERQLKTGALSISFFGLGISYMAAEDVPADLLIGLSPELGVGERELERILRRTIQVFPGAGIQVRLFHQHEAVATTVVLVAFSLWLLDKLGSKIVDTIWSAIFEDEESPARNAELLKAHVRTRNGEFYIEMPISDRTAEMQKALAEALAEVVRQDSGESEPGRVAISYDGEYQAIQHRLPGADADSAAQQESV